jgi:RecB family endonuclease NucS
VPFSMLLAGEGPSRIVRGTIDCLVRHADGRITVVEFKTGRARDAHVRQLDLYVRAARASRNLDERELHGSAAIDRELADVTGVLVYV